MYTNLINYLQQQITSTYEHKLIHTYFKFIVSSGFSKTESSPQLHV